MPKRPNWRAVKIHRNYTMDEAARAVGVAKGTLARWIKSGDLPALTDHRPFLILGKDLQEFAASRKRVKQSCTLAECYCFTCRAPREVAGRMADYWQATAKTGHLEALCSACNRLMHKRFSLARLPDMRTVLDLTIRQAPRPIGKCS